jgi:hypothetical protein
MIHKDLLIAKCPYFRACLNDAFPEGRSNEVCLKKDMPEAFNCLAKWLYFGTISPMRKFNDVHIAFHAYVMADAFLMVGFKNDLMDAVRQYYAVNWMDVGLLELLAEDSNVGGQLRSFVLHQIGHDLLRYEDKRTTEKTVENTPRGHYRPSIDDLLATGSSTAIETFWAFHKFATGNYDDPSKREGCHYHDHPAGTPSCKFSTGEEKKK